MPNIGYGSNKKTRHMISNGLRKFVVSNIKVSSWLVWLIVLVAFCVGVLSIAAVKSCADNKVTW